MAVPIGRDIAEYATPLIIYSVAYSGRKDNVCERVRSTSLLAHINNKKNEIIGKRAVLYSNALYSRTRFI